MAQSQPFKPGSVEGIWINKFCRMSHWSNHLLPCGSNDDINHDQVYLKKCISMLSEGFNAEIRSIEGGASHAPLDDAKLGRFLKLIQIYRETLAFFSL